MLSQLSDKIIPGVWSPLAISSCFQSCVEDRTYNVLNGLKLMNYLVSYQIELDDKIYMILRPVSDTWVTIGLVYDWPSVWTKPLPVLMQISIK